MFNFRLGRLLALLLFPLFVTSCSKDKTDVPAPAPVAPDYTPLRVGNYWVYQVWDHIGSDPATLRPQLDSLAVVGDSVIRGQVFKRLEGREFGYKRRHLLRDSLDYLVDEHGRILFSRTDFSRPLLTYYFEPSQDSTFRITYQMANRDSIITVPALTSPTYNYRGTMNPTTFCPATQTMRYTHDFYAPGVGLIKRVLWYCQDNPVTFTMEQRLVRYRVQP